MRRKKIWTLGLVACLSLAIAGFADHKDGHTKGGGGGETPTIVTTEAKWGGNIGGNITENSPRPCVAAQVKRNGDWGSYVCEVSLARTVNYALGVGVQTARNGDDALCDVFDGIDLTPSKYFYGWSDNCGDGICTIQISNWFSDRNSGETEVFTATDGKADRITLRAFAVATRSFSDVTNPFADSLTLQVDEINISFSAAGSNKGIAECHYSPAVGDVTFQTDPTF